MKNPNGYGSIIKLSGNRRKPFAVRLFVSSDPCTGRNKFKYLGYYEKRSEAMNALAEYHNHPYNLDARTLTLSDVYEGYTDERYTRHDKKIPGNYSCAYKHLSALHEIPFIKIKASTMQEAVDNEKSSSIKKSIKIIFGLLAKFCMANDIVQTNYAPLIKLPKYERSRLHVPFTTEEIAALWNQADRREVKLALLYIYTGFRPTELMKVKTADVHLSENYMRGGMKTAAGINRVVPIAKKVMPFVEYFYNPENEFLVNDNDEPVRTYERMRDHFWFKNDLLKRHHPHDTRHTCATLMDNAGVELFLQQLILGHSSNTITRKVYTHKTIEQLVEAINKI